MFEETAKGIGCFCICACLLCFLSGLGITAQISRVNGMSCESPKQLGHYKNIVNGNIEAEWWKYECSNGFILNVSKPFEVSK